MQQHDSHHLDAEQLARHLAHSPRAVAQTATELAYAARSGQVGPWNIFRRAWCALHGVGEEEASAQMQRLVYDVYDPE